MGELTEVLAAEMGISRKEQDAVRGRIAQQDRRRP